MVLGSLSYTTLASAGGAAVGLRGVGFILTGDALRSLRLTGLALRGGPFCACSFRGCQGHITVWPWQS